MGKEFLTENKKAVEIYMEGFRKSDHEMILSCLTDDVEWYMPGFIDIKGKDAFDKEIENENFTGSPAIQITRMVEENNIVIAEGAVQGKMKNGGTLYALFCDVFEMQNSKIKKLITYQMNK
jgi:limonene-1,2-epoxide hydrolase